MPEELNVKKLTKAKLDDYIEQAVGKKVAEARKEIEADMRQKESDEKLNKTQPIRVITIDEEKEHRQLGLARCIRAFAAAYQDKGSTDPNAAEEYIKKWETKTGGSIPYGSAALKALGESTMSDGGAMVPADYANEVVEVLRSWATFTAAGPRNVPMPSGNFTLPQGLTGSTGYYVEENTDATVSQPTFGQTTMTRKNLIGITPLSNDLIQDSSGMADEFVRDDLAAALAERMDLAMLRDDGSANKPKGAKNWVISANSFSATSGGSTSTLAEMTTDSAKAIRLQDDQKLPEAGSKRTWFIAPRTKWRLYEVLTTDGWPAFRDEIKNGMFFGLPFKMTAQIPINLSGSNSEIYLIDMTHALLGICNDLQIKAFDGGAYYDNSAVRSGISRDQVVIQAKMAHDVAYRHRGKEITYIDTVLWY